MLREMTESGSDGDGAAARDSGVRARTVLGTDLQLVLAGVLRLADIAVIGIVGIASYWLRNKSVDFSDRDLAAIGIGLLLSVIYLHLARLYESDRLDRLTQQVAKLAVAWGAVIVTLVVIGYFTKTSVTFSRIWIATWFLGSILGLVVLRVAAYRLVLSWRRRGLLAHRIIVVGNLEAARRLIAHVRLTSDDGVAIAGLFTDDPQGPARLVDDIPVIPSIDHLVEYARSHAVHEILVALPPGGSSGVGAIMRRIRTLPVAVKLYPDLVDPEVPVRGISLVGGVPMLDVYERPLAGWNVIIKTASDWLLALVILVPMLPVMAAIAVAVKLGSPGPVLFRQRRYGFNNDEFTTLKFRSMRADSGSDPATPQATRDDPRITPVGRFLRRTSLDELPQLINVLAGDMALIGPRPHAVAHNRHYAGIIDGYLGRHRVRPGITGWAQVNGLRGETDTLEKMRMRVQYDLYYIDNWSLLLDLKILLLTPFVTLVGRNAY